jgi:hypothetical protein
MGRGLITDGRLVEPLEPCKGESVFLGEPINTLLEMGLASIFLASDEARWLTGEIIFGSGGLR